MCDWNKQMPFLCDKTNCFVFFFCNVFVFVSDEDTSWSKAASKKVSFNLPEEEDSEEEDSEREDIIDSTISEAKSPFEKRQEKVNSKDYCINFRFRQ